MERKLYVNILAWFDGHMARNLLILSIVCVYTFSASFCMAHCALHLARDHVP